MADIELVIKIPKKLACEGFERLFTEEEKNILIKVIGNGTPLPKSHGRLIDADAYAKKFDTNINGRIGEEYIIAPTIIEADKAESEVSE